MVGDRFSDWPGGTPVPGAYYTQPQRAGESPLDTMLEGFSSHGFHWLLGALAVALLLFGIMRQARDWHYRWRSASVRYPLYLFVALMIGLVIEGLASGRFQNGGGAAVGQVAIQLAVVFAVFTIKNVFAPLIVMLTLASSIGFYLYTSSPEFAPIYRELADFLFRSDYSGWMAPAYTYGTLLYFFVTSFFGRLFE